MTKAKISILALFCVTAGCRPQPPAPPTSAPVSMDTPDVSANVCIYGRPATALEPTPPRLLTREEYNNTVRDLLGDTTRPATSFPPENRTLDFENNADSNVVNPLLVKSYMLAAESISSRAVAERFARVVPCTTTDEACSEQFLRDFTRRAYRRPATPEELASLRALFAKTQAAEGFSAAVEWTVQAVLQSPQFLYRVDFGEALPGSSVVPLSGLELATRLSYFLWASTPDDELLLAAESGALSTVEGVEAQARRMLKDPRARDSVRSFHRQWLHLDGIDSISKSVTKFPEYKSNLRASWRGSVEAFLDDAFWQQGTLSALFSSPKMYVDSSLALLYGVDPPAETGFEAVTTPSQERAGLLTQPALMALLATSNEGSPVKRGVYTREKFLCHVLPSPPPNVPLIPPDPSATATTRERFAEHTANAFCASCHKMIDPLGFAFEHYDGLGRYRAKENGKAVDSSGEISETRDPKIEGPVADAVELSQRFGESAQVRDCIASQWYRYAMGRLEQANDVCSLREVQARFAKSGGNFQELLVAVTTTQAFRFKSAGVAP